MSQRLILRADASSEIGVGHVMRCLALALEWQDAGGESVFACAELPDALADRLVRERCEVVRVHAAPEDLVRLARAESAAWVVMDGYRFAPDSYQHVRDAGLNVLAIDDMAHLSRYPVDVLLNQNLSASALMYRGKVGDSTELLLGPRHSLLRREFRRASPRRRPSLNVPRRVLVSFGGGDAQNWTAFVLHKLAGSGQGSLEVVALAGVANPHVTQLRELAATAPFPCEICVGAENVAALMLWADVAISAAGSTVWEMASLRLPALIAAIEDNQIAGIRALAEIPFFRTGLAVDLQRWDLGTEIETLLRRDTGRDAIDIDTNGATRVVATLKQRMTLLREPVLR